MSDFRSNPPPPPPNGPGGPSGPGGPGAPGGPGWPPGNPPRSPYTGPNSSGDGPRWGLIAIIVGALLLLFIIPVIVSAASNTSPEKWLKDNYSEQGGDVDSSSGLRFASADPVDQTVAAIDAGTDPSEKRQEGSTYYLRYKSDWLVEVEAAPDGSGSEIVLFEFDAGYQSHGALLFFWSSHYQQGGGPFRGGGGGSGK
ncbi:MAG TPA: DUF4247 domain-containing protein [Nocardioides sp.]